MKKKWNSGFTVAEALAILLIVGLITAAAAEAYIQLVGNIKNSLLNTKIGAAFSAAETYANNKGYTKVNIKTLIEDGGLDPDNEFGDYINPVDDESMLCWVIVSDVKDGVVTPMFTGERECDSDKVFKDNSIFDIVQIYEENEETKINPSGEWIGKVVNLRLDLNKERLQEANLGNLTEEAIKKAVTRIQWSSNGFFKDYEINASNPFSAHNILELNVAQIMDTKYEATITLELEIDEKIVKRVYKTYTNVRIDLQNPMLYQESSDMQTWDDDEDSNFEIIGTDYSGSGVKGYYVNTKDEDCLPQKELYKEKENVSIGTNGNGKYYVCIMDNVGNIGERKVLSSLQFIDHQKTRRKFTYPDNNSVETTTPSIHEYSGHEKIGWALGDKRFEKDLDENVRTTIAVPAIYYALYKDKITVTFDGNGGVSAPTQEKETIFNSSGEVNPVDVVMPSTTKTGYTLTGWNTKADGSGTSYNVGATLSNLKNNLTLYAQWKATDYTVTFNANYEGGSVTPPNKVVTYDSTYGELPTPTRTDYNFLGWYTTADGSGTQVTADTTVRTPNNHTLYAKWQLRINLTYNPNGGSVTPTSKIVYEGSAYGELPTPTRTGYTFASWNLNQNGSGTTITADTTVTLNNHHSIYAQWTANSYTVTFDANGGSVNPTSQAVTYDSNYGTLPTPTRDKYKFTGWYTGAGGTGSVVTSDTKVTNAYNHTLYAGWEKLKECKVLMDVVKDQSSIKYGGAKCLAKDSKGNCTQHESTGWYHRKASEGDNSGEISFGKNYLHIAGVRGDGHGGSYEAWSETFDLGDYTHIAFVTGESYSTSIQLRLKRGSGIVLNDIAGKDCHTDGWLYQQKINKTDANTGSIYLYSYSDYPEKLNPPKYGQCKSGESDLRLYRVYLLKAPVADKDELIGLECEQ